MPSYLSPGVYMEEVDRGAKPIEAVGTAVAAFIGYTEKASDMKNGEQISLRGKPSLSPTEPVCCEIRRVCQGGLHAGLCVRLLCERRPVSLISSASRRSAKPAIPMRPPPPRSRSMPRR